MPGLWHATRFPASLERDRRTHLGASSHPEYQPKNAALRIVGQRRRDSIPVEFLLGIGELR
jgi:hypothetical protein